MPIKQQSKCCELCFNRDFTNKRLPPRLWGWRGRAEGLLAEVIRDWSGSGGQVHSYSNHIYGVALCHRYWRSKGDEIIRWLGGLGDTFGTFLIFRCSFFSPSHPPLDFYGTFSIHIMLIFWSCSVSPDFYGFPFPYSDHTKFLGKFRKEELWIGRSSTTRTRRTTWCN